MKRNDLDIIITDLMPVEVPKIFTVKYYYDYLYDNKKVLLDIIKDIKLTKDKNNEYIFKTGWHASALKFNIIKPNNDFRTLSIMNPLSMIEIYIFISIYNKEVVNCLTNPVFSIRYHCKNNDLYYKKARNGVVQYECLDNRNSLEASGTFFSIKPFNRITEFYLSDKWFELNNKFGYYCKTDYKACFDSIYTHVFNWLITDGVVDARKFRNNHLYSVIDRLLQNINSSITNGILVGPEFSRMIAEILLQNIDSQVYEELVKSNYIKGVDYEICRYVDDIFIFTNSQELIDYIISLFKNKSSKYQLRLNELKYDKGILPHIWNEWIDDSRKFVEQFNKRIFYSYNELTENSDYIIKAKNLEKINIISNIKQQFINMITTHYSERQKIVSYVMKAISNQVIRTDKKDLFNKNVTDKGVSRFYDLVFNFYSFAPTFSNTDKLTSIVYMIEKDIGTVRNKRALEEITNKYDYIIINNNLEDIVDFILLIASYKIELNNNIEKDIWKKLERKNNPLLFSVFLIYSTYNSQYCDKVSNKIGNKILQNIDKIKKDASFLLYKEVWWIFIFYDCKYINSDIRFKLKKIIIDLENKINNDKLTSSDKCKKLVLNFFSQSDSYKFINWDMNKEELLESAVFNTYERTLFNNNRGRYYYDSEY